LSLLRIADILSQNNLTVLSWMMSTRCS